ncbi:Stk1 family PASTA domain-containing Ser/Thr kinase [Couchioplanes caeruleus]|uniref:non-specific serine/threonine protein kinase n=2 Tax=Couchioplanes caeruleus TaxID=56438 RepID=A0A1K0FQ05_9ACTN|nr:Stk1 family PASTA domain-containing Ser/Thr kinase [Couchioplanes caeruleus]OJF14927.1 serine/threonine protein kinase [Couchioplanes caeruleus subsp. caeruleus]ROP31062.1 serine/threonine-protein kinase [Couchioplanes caeruleus]
MTAQARLLGGRYQVGELLGYGGMAEVHRGRDLRLGRDVAIKMLRSDLARDATFQERFRREAQNSAALNHPAIVAVYDTGEETSSTGEKQPFIVMEFVNGRTLKEVLAAEQRIQPRRALEMIADICAALEFSHRHGIIHRDIKPGNVMITQNGQVKVMDFGIARALASGATTMTQTSAVIGTAQYLSPEQARGESVDARSDVYAAGCVLFELLVGHPPFVGDSPVSVAYQHVREDPKAPSDINREVSPDIDAIVLKALAKNPLNRYQSAQEMRADALRAVSGRPVMATPVMNEAETMAMSGPMGQAPTAMTRPIPAAATGPGGPQPPERKTSSWVMAVLAALGVLAVVALGIGLAISNRDKESDAPPPQAIVPAVTKMSEEDAKVALKQAGFTNVVTGTPKTTNDCKDTVVEQIPPAKSSLRIDQQITLIMCQSPKKVTVPRNLVGGQQDAAETALRKEGLVPVIEYFDDDAREGAVIFVESEGKEVNPGTKITVRVSKGNLVEVPDVLGKDESGARALLEDRGFTNIKVEPTNEDGAVPGKVFRQTPAGKEKRPTSSAITLFVGAPDTPDPSGSQSPDPDVPPGGGDAGGTGTGIGDIIGN